QQGYRLGATLHADSVDEALSYLYEPPLSIPRALVAEVPLVLVLGMHRRSGTLIRRVAGLYLVERAGDASHREPLVVWDPTVGAFRHAAGPARAALTRRLGLTPGALDQAQDRRSACLERLLARGDLSVEAVRGAVGALRADPGP